jgi:hypothetical protein
MNHRDLLAHRGKKAALWKLDEKRKEERWRHEPQRHREHKDGTEEIE